MHPWLTPLGTSIPIQFVHKVDGITTESNAFKLTDENVVFYIVKGFFIVDKPSDDTFLLVKTFLKKNSNRKQSIPRPRSFSNSKLNSPTVVPIFLHKRVCEFLETQG